MTACNGYVSTSSMSFSVTIFHLEFLRTHRFRSISATLSENPMATLSECEAPDEFPVYLHVRAGHDRGDLYRAVSGMRRWRPLRQL